MEKIISEGKEDHHVIYYIAQPKDVDEVTKFASEYFFKSSPIREMASFDDPTDDSGRFSWNQGRLQQCFARPTSITVREKSSGNVVAFQAMILEDRKDRKASNNEEAEKDNLKNRSPGWLNRALSIHLSRDVDLFDRYQTNRILFFVFAAVRSDYRERKVLSFERVAYRTLMETIIQDNGPVGALKGFAFNRYVTPKDWEIIRSVNFEDFELPDGTRPLAGLGLGSHRTARFIAQRIPQSLEKQENPKTSMISKL